jgi:phosphoglycolate phosphatase
MKMLLFDIDGTLLYTGGAGKIAFNRAAEAVFGAKESWGGIRADGKTDPLLIDEVTQNAVGRFPTEDEAAALRRLYTQFFHEEIIVSERFRVMPGIHELLERLSKEGFLLGLATGNFEATSRLKLKHAKIDEYFGFGGFGCDSSRRAELVRAAMARGQAKCADPILPHHICVIGDTPADIESGRACHIKTMGVATGKFSAAELRHCGADYVLPDLSRIEFFLDCFKSGPL